MKRINPLKQIITGISLLWMAGCSSPLVYNSVWQDKQITIDGKATEWKIPLDYFDDKTKLNFTVTNDKNNLYFCVRATENETQKGIIRSGMQIWIDTTGGKKNQVGIQFPIIERGTNTQEASSKHSDSYESSESSTSMDNMTTANNLKKHYKGIGKEIKLTGFVNAANGLAQVPNTYGINACLNWDTNGIMIYEACIPLGTFYKNSLSLSDSNKVIGISFIVSESQKNNGGGGEGGSHGHGGGGMGGGGMHGGGGHSAGGSLEPEVLTTHIKFRLAVQAPSKQ
jgi:hypothetical protein